MLRDFSVADRLKERFTDAVQEVSEAHGDIRITAPPCKAMFRVAATSQRDDQVTRRIHKLHAIQQSVIAMSVARAMGVAFERRLNSANCTAKAVERRYAVSIPTTSGCG